MPSIDSIHLSLLDVELELSALNYYVDFLEKQIKQKQDDYQSEIKDIKKRGPTPDDLDWQHIKAYEDMSDLWIPRIFRYPFIVTLYAVYETAVSEIAENIKKQKMIDISINDLRVRGGFLNKAKKYFNDFLPFQLCDIEGTWNRITMLSEIRNAIAHTNGRIEMLNKGTKQKIINWEKQKLGISLMNGFIVVEEVFLKDTFNSVSSSLNDLIKRYREWEDSQTTSLI